MTVALTRVKIRLTKEARCSPPNACHDLARSAALPLLFFRKVRPPHCFYSLLAAVPWQTVPVWK
jgi:hypothetical protein